MKNGNLPKSRTNMLKQVAPDFRCRCCRPCLFFPDGFQGNNFNTICSKLCEGTLRMFKVTMIIHHLGPWDPGLTHNTLTGIPCPQQANAFDTLQGCTTNGTIPTCKSVPKKIFQAVHLTCQDTGKSETTRVSWCIVVIFAFGSKLYTLNSLTIVAKGLFFFQGSRLRSSWIILDRCFSHWSPASRVPVSKHDPSLPLLRVRLAWDLKIKVEQRINAGICKNQLKLQSDLKETISKCQLKSHHALFQSAYQWWGQYFEAAHVHLSQAIGSGCWTHLHTGSLQLCKKGARKLLSWGCLNPPSWRLNGFGATWTDSSCSPGKVPRVPHFFPNRTKSWRQNLTTAECIFKYSEVAKAYLANDPSILLIPIPLLRNALAVPTHWFSSATWPWNIFVLEAPAMYQEARNQSN